MIDLIVLLPFYLELLFPGVDVLNWGRLTALRLVRVFRFLKMFSFLPQLRYVVVSLLSSCQIHVLLTDNSSRLKWLENLCVKVLDHCFPCFLLLPF